MTAIAKQHNHIKGGTQQKNKKQRVQKTLENYMPIKLKGILVLGGIRQAEWAAQVIQKNGKGLSGSASTSLLNWDAWPKETSKESIKQQTEDFLRAQGVTEETISIIWDFDKEDKHRAAKPRGFQKSQPIAPIKQVEFEPVEAEMLSDQAKKHFKITKDPFVNDVQKADDVFLSDEHRYIREAMFNTAKSGGFLAIIGESGSGKTTLRRDLIDRINTEGLPITVIQPQSIDKSKLNASAICDAVIGDICQERTKKTLEAKARHVKEKLLGSSRAGYSHVLMIEEAHDLLIQTLKYLKRFWELEDGFKKLLSIILIGQPELKEKLDERRNYEAREVIRRCETAELMPLNGDLESYLALKFKRIGINMHSVLAKDACDAIRERLTIKQFGDRKIQSMLYPLVVNNLITKAMNACAMAGAEKINADVIKEL